MTTTYKVAVWATGGVGKYAIRTIVDRTHLDLVGVWVHSDEKKHCDAGELAGIGALGVHATRDELEILNGDADCVVYAAPTPHRMKEAIRDLCRILAAGKNVVTTSMSGLVHSRGSLPDKIVNAIREAAESGQSSLFSTGIEPGFAADLFPIALMTMAHRVYSVRGIEITNYSRYANEYDMRELFGFGKPLDYKGGLTTPGVLRWGWGAAVTMVADALGVGLDEIRETCDFLPTPRDIATAFGLVEAGTVGATRARCIGVVDGQEVITIEHVDRIADDLAPDWPKSRSGGTDGTWRVIIDGEPSIDAEFEVGHHSGENHGDHGLLATAMRAVNAIPAVCAAPPGIVEALHIPLTAPLGALHPRRDGIPAFVSHGGG
ncbi:dihydrodipicolinate reductase [Mycobacterium terramassiliense]|uniref:NAD(P)H-dependent amine dehydrogenase family protein n=1 Tax=Mycobacterium terramassiliense TaxID=1841859 RepID=UPI0012FF8D03|nr:dihydrodipicolinate reductase [Mycobacterium terramassiliense]